MVVSLRCFPGWRLTPPRRWRVWGFFLVEDYLLTDELWRAWGRSDNSYLDEMMDTVNILWRCWFQSQLDQYYTTVGLQLIEVFQISKMELGVSRKKRYWWNWYLSRENQDVGSLGNYNNPTQPGLLLGVVLFIFVILLSYDNKVWLIKPFLFKTIPRHILVFYKYFFSFLILLVMIWTQINKSKFT